MFPLGEFRTVGGRAGLLGRARALRLLLASGAAAERKVYSFTPAESFRRCRSGLSHQTIKGRALHAGAGVRRKYACSGKIRADFLPFCVSNRTTNECPETATIELLPATFVTRTGVPCEILSVTRLSGTSGQYR